MTALPHPSTPFVGRADELRDIAARLTDPACRLLTLVGPGGIGKTRLALQAAAESGSFEHSVYFVPLTSLNTAEQIAPTIATALEIRLITTQDPRVVVSNHLSEKRTLLVMDNFEHLLDGVDLLPELLSAAPGLKILVTSRERLNLSEEWVIRLDGLAFPPEHADQPLETYSAVELFVQRARQTQAKFALSDHAEAVLTICQQVEGMPLGLELAATWLRVMSCQQIAAHMTGSLDFLTTPHRNIPERHRSLRVVFDQSWNLLTEPEQLVLMKLSVFRGGFDLQAAQQVAGASLPVLAGLADKSLVRLSDPDRYDLHELLRQYAANKLQDMGEAEAAIQRHFDYFLALAEGAEAHNFGREQIAWYDRLEVELDNLRAAMTWAEHQEAGLRLAAALGWFFSERTYWQEGLGWTERLLNANPDAPPSLRAKALHHACSFAGHLADNKRIKAYGQAALDLSQSIGDDWNTAWALSHLALFLDYHNYNRETGILLDQSIALFRQLGDKMGLCHNLMRRAWHAIDKLDLNEARHLLSETEALATEAGDIIMIAWVSNTFGRIEYTAGQDLLAARSHFEKSVELSKTACLQEGVNLSTLGWAGVEMKLGNLDLAEQLYREGLRLHTRIMPNHPRLPTILSFLGRIAAARGHFERAVRLLSACDLRWAPESISIPYQDDIAALRAHMGEADFTAAWAAGKAMSLQEVETYALQSEPLADSAPEKHTPALLNKRELEILHLVAEGLSNSEIAQQLHFTVSTVKWYLSEIYSKLGVSGRAKAVAHAREQGLIP